MDDYKKIKSEMKEPLWFLFSYYNLKGTLSVVSDFPRNQFVLKITRGAIDFFEGDRNPAKGIKLNNPDSYLFFEGGASNFLKDVFGLFYKKNLRLTVEIDLKYQMEG